MSVSVLITVNVQNDFCDGGVYPLKNSAERIRVINSLREHADLVVHSRLLLQPNHYSFRSCNPGAELGDPLAPRDHHQQRGGGFRRQKKPQREIKECIVNPYCVRGTKGAEFHPDLVINQVGAVHHMLYCEFSSRKKWAFSGSYFVWVMCLGRFAIYTLLSFTGCWLGHLWLLLR